MSRLFGIAVLGIVVYVTVLLSLLPTPVAESAGQVAISGSRILIKDVYLADSYGQRTTTSMLLRNGLIELIAESIDASADVQVIDASGLTAVPGLIDSHTHTYGSALEDALRFGVTTTVDMFSPPTRLDSARAARDALEPTVEADLYSAGMLATAEGGHGTQFGTVVDTLAEPADASTFVRDRMEEGSDFIKLVYMPGQSGLPSLDRDTARAVIAAAHDNGLMAVAHISTQRAALDMVEDDIDGLVHIFADENISDTFIEQAVTRDVFVIPTLAVIAAIDGRHNDRDQAGVERLLSPMQQQTLGSAFADVGSGFNLDIALNNVRRLHAAGIRILAGSDAPNPGTAHGYSLHEELALLVEAGLTAAEAMQSASDLAVSTFNLGKRGTLAQGQRADVLLLQGNPYQNISATRNIRYVIKNGYVVPRSEFEVESAPAISTGVLGTFDDDLTGPDGLTWDATVDSIAGGNSTAIVQRVARPGGGHALAVSAAVKPGFAWPWAGAGLGSADPDTAIDVSDYANIVFDVKGTPGVYRFLLFSGMSAGAPPTREFSVSSEWKTVRIPLTEFAGFRPEAFSMLGIVAGPAPNTVDFIIDEVRFEP